LLRGAFNELIECWISKNSPPQAFYICLRVDARVVLFEPVVLNYGSGRFKVRTYRTAANREHNAQQKSGCDRSIAYQSICIVEARHQSSLPALFGKQARRISHKTRR